MKTTLDKGYGYMLIISSALMLFAMVLHPTGGSLEYLLKSAKFIIVSHSLAILAIPFLGIGFWGLLSKLGTNNLLSVIAFSIVVVGLIAGMIAATINGLALPIYLQNFKNPSPELTSSIKLILKNTISINQAFDFVFIGAICLSTFFWSIAIIVTKKMPLSIGYAGIILFIVFIGFLMSGFVFINLRGFRLFIISIVAWIVYTAIVLIRSKKEKNYLSPD